MAEAHERASAKKLCNTTDKHQPVLSVNVILFAEPMAVYMVNTGQYKCTNARYLRSFTFALNIFCSFLYSAA